MNLEKLIKQLIEHEGLRLKPYRCTAEKLTIGVGRNLEDKGITEKEAMQLLQNDISECEEDITPLFINFRMMPDAIQRVLIDMRFNLGPARFRKFKKMITAVNQRNMEEMIKQMKDSVWYTQVSGRAEKLIKMLEGD